MKTQTITVQIDAEVPVGKYCTGRKPGQDKYNYKDFKCPKLVSGGYCGIFSKYLVLKEIAEFEEWWECKTQQCLDACANGTERALKELAE